MSEAPQPVDLEALGAFVADHLDGAQSTSSRLAARQRLIHARDAGRLAGGRAWWVGASVMAAVAAVLVLGWVWSSAERTDGDAARTDTRSSAFASSNRRARTTSPWSKGESSRCRIRSGAGIGLGAAFKAIIAANYGALPRLDKNTLHRQSMKVFLQTPLMPQFPANLAFSVFPALKMAVRNT